MTQPILHHYTLSSFSEKVRVALGFKDLAYARSTSRRHRRARCSRR